MDRKCFVTNCKSGYNLCDKKLSFFEAPADRIVLWRTAIPRKERILSSNDYICEKHFHLDDIRREWQNEGFTIKLLQPRLTKDAVPAILLNCPKYLCKSKTQKRRILNKQDFLPAVKISKLEHGEQLNGEHKNLVCPIMPKHKMIAKGCPKCEQQVPVACKACPCGHSFFNARRTTRGLSPGEEYRRRTQRVCREKPNYYDALEYDKQIKKAKLRNSECEDDDKKDMIKCKRRRIKKEDEEDDEQATPLTPEKQLLCAVILAELNRKLQVVTWKPT